RDVAIIWSVVTTALFYGSAVLYPVSLVPEGFLRTIVNINPLVPLFVQTNKWMIDPDAPSAVAAAGGWGRLAIPIGIFALTFVVAARTLRGARPEVDLSVAALALSGALVALLAALRLGGSAGVPADALAAAAIAGGLAVAAAAIFGPGDRRCPAGGRRPSPRAG